MFTTEDISVDMPMFIQRADLEAMKRQAELRAALENHIRHLTEGSTTFTLLVNLIDESSKDLRKGAMPEWYENEAMEIGLTIRSLAERLFIMGERLEQEYLG